MDASEPRVSERSHSPSLCVSGCRFLAAYFLLLTLRSVQVALRDRACVVLTFSFPQVVAAYLNVWITVELVG